MCGSKPCGGCGGRSTPPHPGQPWPGAAVDVGPSITQGPAVALRAGLPFLEQPVPDGVRSVGAVASPPPMSPLAAAIAVAGRVYATAPVPTRREQSPAAFQPARSWGGNSGQPWHVGGRRPPTTPAPSQPVGSAGVRSLAQQGAPVQQLPRVDVVKVTDAHSAEAHALPVAAHKAATTRGVALAGGLVALLVLL